MEMKRFVPYPVQFLGMLLSESTRFISGCAKQVALTVHHTQSALWFWKQYISHVNNLCLLQATTTKTFKECFSWGTTNSVGCTCLDLFQKQKTKKMWSTVVKMAAHHQLLYQAKNLVGSDAWGETALVWEFTLVWDFVCDDYHGWAFSMHGQGLASDKSQTRWL